MGNLGPPPPPPNEGWENGAFWLLRGFILDLIWGLVFHFILSKIVDSLQRQGIDLAQTRNLRRAPFVTSVSVPRTTLFIYP